MTQEPRKIEFDVEALLLSGLCGFLWLSLLSYDPADAVGPLPAPLSSLIQLDTVAYPQNAEVQNWCGWTGALAATILVQSFGIGSIMVAIGLSVLAVWMFRVQSNHVRASRQIGWALVIIAATTLVSLLKLETPLAPVIGAGGYLGIIVSTWLNAHFAWIGGVILMLAVFMAGLLLSTDYVVLRAVAWMFMGGANVAKTTVDASRKRVSIPSPFKRRQAVSDVEQGVQWSSEEQAMTSDPPIRIRGKDVSAKDAAKDTKDAKQPPKSDEVNQEAAAAGGVLATAAKTLAGGWLTGDAGKKPEAAAEDDVWPDEEADPQSAAEVEEDEAAAYRELDVDGDVLQVRGDSSHADGADEPPEPRVRVPKTKASKQAERQAMSDALAHLDDTKLPAGAEEYVLPGLDLLLESDDIDFEAQAVEVRRKAKILENTFKDFGFNVRVVEIETGPVIAQYEIELEAGLRLSKITSLSDDLAIALRVPSVRIVAPIPGKNTVGIEVPNEVRQIVRLREVIEEQGAKSKKSKIPLFLGKDVSGNALTADLATLPHLLIAGRTGTGKSVCLNAIIASILMTRRPDEVRMLMIDPKMVELSGYGRLPHLMHPVVTDMRKAEAILAWAVDKMEERYALLARVGVRHLTNYNELGREELIDRLKPESAEEADAIPDHLPFIVIVADEMADLMMTAGKEVEAHIIRLAQKSRAVGIHLILATQKPTVDVITGLIKSNLPARIAFQVASRTDSRVVLDEMGADKLLGNGDMLFMGNGTSMLLRGQGTYLSDEEINAVVDHCSQGEQNFVNELVNLKVKDQDGEEPTVGAFKRRDDLYEAAVDVVVREGRGSCSLLQRALGIGYGRAARLIDFMAEDGIVGEYAGSQAREVQISIAEWEAMRGEGDSPPAPPQRSNKVRPLESTPNFRRSGELTQDDHADDGDADDDGDSGAAPARESVRAVAGRPSTTSSSPPGKASTRGTPQASRAAAAEAERQQLKVVDGEDEEESEWESGEEYAADDGDTEYEEVEYEDHDD